MEEVIRFSMVQQFPLHPSKIKSGERPNQEKISFLQSYSLLTHKKNDAYLTDSEYSACLLKKRSRL